MGELINLNSQGISAIPDEIARDTEVTAAIAAHVSVLHPFPIFGFGQNISTENVFNSGSGFLDCLGGGGNFPPNMGHIQGFQAKFNNSAGNWGMQLVTQNNIDNECYFRVVNWDVWKPWRRIWNDGNFNPSNYLLQSEGDGRYRQSAVALTDADIPATIARDSEVSAAVANHAAAIDPHAQYLLQSEGDARYRQSSVAITDAELPGTIARDSEVSAAIQNHVTTSLHAVKTKWVTSATNSTKGQLASTTHGLNVNKIIGFFGIVQIYPNTWLPFYNLGAPDQSITLELNSDSVVVGNSNTTWVNATGKTFRVVIFYID